MAGGLDTEAESKSKARKQKRILQANGNQKKAMIVTLISDKTTNITIG